MESGSVVDGARATGRLGTATAVGGAAGDSRGTGCVPDVGPIQYRAVWPMAADVNTNPATTTINHLQAFLRAMIRSALCVFY